MKPAVLQVLIILILATSVNSYAMYQEQIPNGDTIPHPCKPNFIWKGVGHLKSSGGGQRNQFGKDFNAANKKWTTSLCKMDSDGDGITNGVELGDPECSWTSGTVPKETTGITHPGICDPWASPQCEEKNTWVSCDDDVFKCPAIEEEEVRTIDLRFPSFNVPPKETSYYCVGFDLPTDGNYHMIATTPIINESKVMHHIGLFGCDDDSVYGTEPVPCKMGLQGCAANIGLWTLGLPGQCFYKDAGFKIGKHGYKKAALQFHWTNPEERDDLWDSSGMRLYYTDTLRKYNSGTYFTGQLYLEIPPLSPKVVQHSTCSPQCTQKQITGSIFLTTGINHMHYLGIAEYVKLIRTDGTELMLTNESDYHYDTPILHEYDPPIEVKPGDSIETVCTFKSMSRKTTAFFGEGTFDEMCFGFFNFYPADAMRPPFDSCVSSKDYEYCNIECDIMSMMNFTNPETRELVDRVLGACSYFGNCLHGCRQVVDDIKASHRCFKDGTGEGFTYEMLLKSDIVEAFKFVIAMQSCDFRSENPIIYQDQTTGGDITTQETSGVGSIIATSFVIFISCSCMMI